MQVTVYRIRSKLKQDRRAEEEKRIAKTDCAGKHPEQGMRRFVREDQSAGEGDVPIARELLVVEPGGEAAGADC